MTEQDDNKFLEQKHKVYCVYLVLALIWKMRYALVILTVTSLQSCIFTRVDDSIDLGKNFRYIQDYPQGIIYQLSEEHIGSGPYAILGVVLNYAYDDNWIIAINKDLEDQQKRYWIVDKNKDYKSITPLDSITFYQNIKKWNIELKLSKN